jgi:hypothetical protein
VREIDTPRLLEAILALLNKSMDLPPTPNSGGLSEFQIQPFIFGFSNAAILSSLPSSFIPLLTKY